MHNAQVWIALCKKLEMKGEEQKKKYTRFTKSTYRLATCHLLFSLHICSLLAPEKCLFAHLLPQLFSIARLNITGSKCHYYPLLCALVSVHQPYLNVFFYIQFDFCFGRFFSMLPASFASLFGAYLAFVICFRFFPHFNSSFVRPFVVGIFCL